MVKDASGNNGYLRVSVGEAVALSGFVVENLVGDNGDTEEIILAYRRVGAVVVEEGWAKLSVCALFVDVSHDFAAVTV